MSSEGECVGDVWVLAGGVATLYWRFLGGSILVLASSGISSSLVLEKSTIGLTIALISPSKTSFIVSSYLMFPSRSGVLDELVGDFLANLT